MSRITLFLASLVTVVACSGDAIGPAPADITPGRVIAASQIEVVMSGLNSPRGLGWGPEGGLYVAEAGTAVTTGACTEFLEGAMLATKCWSGTGSVSRLWKGSQTRVATGLPSTYITESGFTSGPQDISFAGRGHAMVALGWGGAPSLRAALGPAAADAGTLIQLQPSGGWRVVADISGFEESANPAGGILDSNPYGVLAESAQSFVVDAGGNSLLKVGANGKTSLVATFPSTAAPAPWNQAESVPTRVKRGPDGALYVSTLSGVPFAAGAAVIYRVEAGQQPVVYLGGFKSITDFAFSPDGGVYVLQFATSFLFFGGPGALIHVAPDGTRTTVTTDLFQPTGIVLDDEGSVYVSNRGTSSGDGEVLKITP
ncbi:MAG: ScyD/ScyE family protein [Gemmatimonadaceae bacterium]